MKLVSQRGEELSWFCFSGDFLFMALLKHFFFLGGGS